MNCYYNGNKVTVNVEGKEEKPLTIRTKKDWLLDDNIVEAYQYEHYSNAEAGSTITFSVAEHNGNNKTSLTITPDDSTDNDNYVEDNGVYKIKETANTSIYVFKLKDGSWKFRAAKVK